MTIRVVSKRVGGTKPDDDETLVFIARPSLLQNSVKLVWESQRDACIAEHNELFEWQYIHDWAIRKEIDSLAARVRSGERIALVCWCSPKACHGDNYVRKINQINAAKKTRRVIDEEEL